jgi:hypothetical protein
MSAGHDEDKRGHGIRTTTTRRDNRRYERSWDTNYHDPMTRVDEAPNQSMNCDTTPLSGRAPSLEGPRGDEVNLLSPLTLHSLYCLGMLEVLTTPMHLGVDVSDLILQLLYLFCSVCHARFPEEGDDVWRPGLRGRGRRSRREVRNEGETSTSDN